MINKLFSAQLDRLAVALSTRRGTPVSVEVRSILSVAVTVENSVSDLFAAAGLAPDVAELVARAYAAGWIDALHRETGATLADAVLERTQPMQPVGLAAAPLRLN